MDELGWWVVVPMKDMRLAKTRLGGTQGYRRQVAILMARDTLCAIVNTAQVRGVMVVCEREEDVESFSLPGITVTVRPGLGLNEAIAEGVGLLRKRHPDSAIAVLPGDLPYLRSPELNAALAHAQEVPLAVVGDRTGTGSTLTTARPGVDLVPSYGEGSLGRHRAAGAVELSFPSWSGLRRDVDVPSDLRRGPALGRRTDGLLERLANRNRKVGAGCAV